MKWDVQACWPRSSVLRKHHFKLPPLLSETYGTGHDLCLLGTSKNMPTDKRRWQTCQGRFLVTLRGDSFAHCDTLRGFVLGWMVIAPPRQILNSTSTVTDLQALPIWSLPETSITILGRDTDQVLLLIAELKGYNFSSSNLSTLFLQFLTHCHLRSSQRWNQKPSHLIE